jgi:RNA polymerase sigma factor (sigma-70 family)
MNEHDWLATKFETDRPRLRAVAYRMLGSRAEADDAVQEAWLRLSRSDTSVVENLDGWLTTIVARVSLNMLKSRASRREELIDPADVSAPATADPEQETLLADSVGLALLVVLDTLTPAERLAFVLHDMFAVPFKEIAPIVDRSPAAVRQLASRARRRVQQTDIQDSTGALDSPRAPDSPHARDSTGAQDGPRAPDSPHARDTPRALDSTGARDGTAGTETKEDLIRAFLAASREGNFDALLAMLDPDIVMRADQIAVQLGVAAAAEARGADTDQLGADAEVRGADAVGRIFASGAQAARPALIDGDAGLVWAPGGRPRVVFRFTVEAGTITAIDLQGDLDGLDITMLRNQRR